MPFDSATGIYTSAFPPVAIPDDLSIDQFIFQDCDQTTYDPQWLVDSATGRTLTRRQARVRAYELARGFRHCYGLEKDDTVVLFSGNEVDYPTVLWGTFRCQGVVSCANPNYSAQELMYQLKKVHEFHPVKVLVTHPASLAASIEALKLAGLPESLIVLMHRGDNIKLASASKFRTLDDIVRESQEVDVPRDIDLAKGEAKNKVAFLSFSSGTTGLPKAVVISHYSVVSNILQGTAYWKATVPFKPYDASSKTGDVVLGCLPFFHIYGLVVVLHTSLHQNTPVVVMTKFTLPTFLAAIQDWKVTTLHVVPPQVVMLVKSPVVAKYDLSSLRFGMAGAAPLTAELAKSLSEKFPKLTFGQGYGMTETTATVLSFDPTDRRVIPGASAGKLIQNVEVKVVSADGKLQPPGEVGEILVRSPANALCYLANDKATRETFDTDGFVHTGDEVRIDPDGWVYVVDRIKELIKVSGFGVAPAELEGLLIDHPSVSDVCVIGIADEKTGEKPKAYVVLSPAAQSSVEKNSAESLKLVQSIKEFVKKNKIYYKQLSEVEFLPAIPKTPSGKLLRKDLRVLHAQTMKRRLAKL